MHPLYDNDMLSENPDRTTGKFGGFTTLDRWLFWLVIAVATVIWAATTLLIAVLCAIILLSPLYRLEMGRVYRLGIRRWRGAMIRHHKNVIWQAEAVSRRKFSPPRRRWSNPVSPMGIAGVGFMHYRPRQSDTVIITGDGSNLVSNGVTEQLSRHVGFANAIKRVASTKGYAIGVSQIFQRRPANGLQHQIILDESLHPEVAVPEALLKDEADYTAHDRRMLKLKQNQDELTEVYREKSGSVTMAVSLTVQRDSLLAAAIKHQSLPPRQLPRLILSQIADSAIKGLTAFGVDGLAVLDEDGIEDFIREGWDAADNDEYRDEAALTRAGMTTQSEAIYWPCQRILAYDDYCVMDNTFITVVRMTGGKKTLLLGEMRQLYAVDIPWVTITVVGEAVSSRKEYNKSNFLLNLLDDSKETFGYRSRGAKATRIDDERQQRLANIDQSGFIQAYNILAAVSARSLDDLEIQVTEMLSHADYLGLMPVRVTGEDFQLPTVWSAMTGINML